MAAGSTSWNARIRRATPANASSSSDEEALLESVERDEWRSARGGKRERALEEGLPYQTLIASLLHKYASGRLKEV